MIAAYKTAQVCLLGLVVGSHALDSYATNRKEMITVTIS